jgi:hypothetical protein
MALELSESSYPKRDCSPEDIVVPMCQSPKIADVLLLARNAPANDNHLLVKTDANSRKSKGARKAALPIVAVLLGLGTLLFLLNWPS